MAQIQDRIVKSKYEPNNTNVIWIDTSNKKAVIKIFNNGVWVEPQSGSHLSYSVLEDKPSINNVALENNKTSAQLGLESRVAIISSRALDAILTTEDNTIYDYGELTSLDITIPNKQASKDIPIDYISQINFSSGSTPTQLSDNGDINWIGDDINEGMFVPVAGKRYVIMLYFDGVDMRGVVSGTTPIPEESEE